MPTIQEWSQQSPAEINQRIKTIVARRGDSLRELARLHQALKIAQERIAFEENLQEEKGHGLTAKERRALQKKE